MFAREEQLRQLAQSNAELQTIKLARDSRSYHSHHHQRTASARWFVRWFRVHRFFCWLFHKTQGEESATTTVNDRQDCIPHPLGIKILVAQDHVGDWLA